ncbi:Adenylate-forming reductase 06235 [Psilocybe cubensis]|uniref:Adenylate-forming reductase 06235 n=1 Tax=Psilocybe cubensis TaxID=181762 RepID=A0ACB8HC42_PSICU|nr:Adenylate-forming reductase 06235 [Psilocybe cubensis]KAH9485483.1 Adenylate-forming reductase 06235 [Psilocybe cubensis]
MDLPPRFTIDDAEKGTSDQGYPVAVTLPMVYSKPSLSATETLSSLPAPHALPTPSEKHPSLPPPFKRNLVSSSPAKRLKKRASRWIRFQLWFNTYRKFFTFVMAMNLSGIALAIFNVWSYPRKYTGAFVLGNLLTAILMRNELFGRFLYLTVNTLFAKWTPLPFRLACTSVLQHLGGIHSGCATSGFLWLIFRVVTILIHHKNNHDAVLKYSPQRVRKASPLHGLVTWIFVVLGDSYDLETHSWNPDGFHIVRQQDFWFAFGMTVFVIIPWFTIREVKVDVEIPSPKVAIIRFERGMQQGLLARISRGSIMEYHAFGIISEGIHSKEHYLICGVQGDFTRSLVENPPTHLWTRQLKFAGVSNTSTLYKKGIRVCTGTGLGAALSTCLQNPNWYLIWIGSDQEKTFGPTISRLISKNLEPERVTLWDSKQRGGRPDTMKLIKEVYDSWGAEVVFITSNLQGNTEMMEGCKEAGIPAFGTLWDF